MTLLNYYTSIISDVTEINDKNIIMLIQLIITNDIVFKDEFKFKLNYNNFQSVLGNTLINSNSLGIKQSLALKQMYKTFFIKEMYKYINTIEVTNICIINKNDIMKIIDIIPANKIFNVNFGTTSEDLFLSVDKSQNSYHPFKKLIGWHLSTHLLNDTTVKHLRSTLNHKYGYITDECLSYIKQQLHDIHDKFMIIYNHPKMILYDDANSDKKMVCICIILMLKSKIKITKEHINMINMEGEILHAFYKNLVKQYLSFI